MKQSNKTLIQYSDILTTTYEKVMNILYKVKEKLFTIGEVSLVDEMKFVISKIENKQLYSYSNNMDDKTEEVKNLIQSLDEYSEISYTRKNKESIFSKALKLKIKKKTVNTLRPSSKSLFIKSIIEKINDVEQSQDNHIKDSSESLIDDNQNDNRSQRKNNSLFSKTKSNKISNIYIENFPLVLEKDFNIFNFFNEHGEKSFSIIFKVIMIKTKCDVLIDLSKLDTFLNCVMKGYNTSPSYHNKIHGIDVCHLLFLFWYYSFGFEDKIKFTKTNLLTLLVSAICHDIGHPGLNNNFHINSYSDYAVIYNDKSVLESYHASESMRIILNPLSNIFSNFDKTEFKVIRRNFIEAILSTDMMFHARTNSIVKSRLFNNKIENGVNIDLLVPNNEEEAFEVIQELMNFLLHSADIGHNTRKYNISKIWVHRLTEEFWLQGDKEKELGIQVSFLCDRQTANVPKSQIGFYKGVIIPTYSILLDIFPDLGFLMENIEENLKEWEDMSVMEEAEERNDVKIMLKDKKQIKITLNKKAKQEFLNDNKKEECNLVYETKYNFINIDNTIEKD